MAESLKKNQTDTQTNILKADIKYRVGNWHNTLFVFPYIL